MAPKVMASKIVVVVGPPGSGKGTVCQAMIAEHPGRFIHLGTGDLVRQHVQDKTELGKRFETYSQKGDFIPDSMMIAVVQDRISRPDVAGKTVLLDGFPRTRAQAAALSSSCEVDRVLLLQSSDDLCVKRILGRQIDPVTAQVYNVHSENAKPPTAEIAARLVTRPLDKDEDTIRKRLRAFHSMLPPILNFFKGRVFAVNSAQDKRRVVDAVVDILEKHLPTAEELQKLEEEFQRKQAAAVAKPTVVVKDRRGECIICRDAPADFLCLPCGHQCGCESCLNMMKSDNFGGCPICRTKIQGIVQVYQAGHVDDDPDAAAAELAAAAAKNGGNADAKADDMSGMTADDILGAGWLQHYQYKTASGGGAGAGAGAAAAAPASNTGSAANRNDLNILTALCEPRGDTSTNKMAVTVNVPDQDPNVPIDVCCVIDISGSMGSEATFQDPNDDSKVVGSGMMNLDLVKHSVKTIIETLGDRDRISIVAFDDKADMALRLTALTGNGKKLAAAALDKLEPRGATNIWGGMLAGLDSLRNDPALNGHRKFLFCLTDGKPNYSPPDGEDAELAKYMARHAQSGFSCMVSTFGFGYQLKSKLMLDIARIGNGTFAFIPDAKLLGTCFVNAVANARSCRALDAKLQLTLKNGAKFASEPLVDGSLPWKAETGSTVVVDLGPLNAGQSRDVVVNLQGLDQVRGDLDILDVTLSLPDGRRVTGSGSLKFAPTQASIAANARNTSCAGFAAMIRHCDEDRADEAHSAMRVLAGKITALEALTRNAVIKGLTADINGRASKAMSTDERWERWGAHYLRALYRSHQYQMRTNFLDPGLQSYGGNLFDGLVERGGSIFKKLPMKTSTPLDAHDPAAGMMPPNLMVPPNMPQPGSAPNMPTRANRRRPPTPPPVDNEIYYGGGGGGCFAGDCTVVTQKGATKAVRDVRRGDRLRLANGEYGAVDVVVELRAPRCDMVTLPESGLVITPNHPLKEAATSSSWTRPRALATAAAERSSVPAVYNFVFAKRPTCGLEVNGIECVTYFHAVPELQHKFYTCESGVMRALRDEAGFKAGYVVVPRRTLKK